MSLRTKCAILLVAFELTLAATLMLTVRYIGLYFEDAAESFSVSSGGMASVGRLRTMLRNELTGLLGFVQHPAALNECERAASSVTAAAAAMQGDAGSSLSPRERATLDRLMADRERTVRAFLATAGAPPGASGAEQPVPRMDPAAHLGLDAFLGQLESRMLGDIRGTVENAFSAQQRAALILSVNMIVGAALGVLGLLLVRRWVLLPLAELKQAADEIGRGNLAHRAKAASADEMGQLAAAINKMSADLARIEKQMVQRERLAAMGELMSYVAHNIRNPLAGIRSLTEACRRRSERGSELHAHHDEIIAAIDRFQQWLRQLEHSCSPLQVRAEPVDIGELVDNVMTVFRPMSERRSVRMEKLNGVGRHVVQVDPRHFEQALAAIVGNAVEAAGDRGKVTIGLDSAGSDSQWSLYVADSGPGIPPEIRDKLFEPTFSTKKGGHGLGLALVRRVVGVHGGQISVECPPPRGTVFRIVMPAEPNARMLDGRHSDRG